jgi:hypothetical protein
MKHMGSEYMKRSSSDLRTLRSQKVNRLASLERKRGWSYHDMLEMRTLKFHISNIDAVLAARDAQGDLL